MRHFASSAFWDLYQELPAEIRELADKNYELLRKSPRHPSLHLKQIGRYWSVRVGARHRALGIDADGDAVWFWIGTHAAYDRLLRSK